MSILPKVKVMFAPPTFTRWQFMKCNKSYFLFTPYGKFLMVTWEA
jgi:hypothetical protein